MSVKKLKKGDADWTTEKQILGWLLDGVRQTVSLPPDKAKDYQAAVRCLLQPRRRRVKRKEFKRVVRKLCFASLAIPAGQGLFAPLNAALKGGDKKEIGGPGSPQRLACPPLGHCRVPHPCARTPPDGVGLCGVL